MRVLALAILLLSACEPLPSRTAMTQPSCVFACRVDQINIEVVGDK